MLTVGGLFSGIGGWELGLERAGMRVVWHCEQDEFCQRVLARHWPGVPCYPDVRALVADTDSPELRNGQGPQREAAGARIFESGHNGAARLPDLPVSVPPVDVLCGGFPCQDISVAGKGAGITGARSGLWGEFARLIGDLRPRYVLVENVAALASRGLDTVLGDLAALGFDAEWDCLPASAFGAPHRRDRLWLVAYPARDLQTRAEAPGTEWQRVGACGESRDVGYANGPGPQGRWGHDERPDERPVGTAGVGAGVMANAGRIGCREGSREFGGLGAEGRGWWLTEPDVGRVAHGIPARVDRLRSLGNALVPQISEWIGRRIVEWEAA